MKQIARNSAIVVAILLVWCDERIALAQVWPPRPPRSAPVAENVVSPARVVITNVTVIDGTGARPRDNILVVLDGDRIESISRVGERPIRPEVQVHDMRGHFVLPGLIESHTHLRPLAAISRARLDAELDRMLHGGIVTARGMGGNPELHGEASRAAEQPPGAALPLGVVDSSADVEGAVAQATRVGARAITIVAEIRAPLMRSLVDAAHEAADTSHGGSRGGAPACGGRPGLI